METTAHENFPTCIVMVKNIWSDYDITHVFPSTFNITHNPLLQ